MLIPVQQDLTLLRGSDKMIIQQTNLQHVDGQAGKGLAQILHETWPHCHPYNRYGVRPELGSVQTFPSHDNSPVISCLNAQRWVGWKQMKEDYDERLEAFRTALNTVQTELRGNSIIKEVYIPDQIGCGLGRGDWKKYLPVLEAFAIGIPQRCYLAMNLKLV